MLFLLSQFPGIIKLAILLIQTVGGYAIALISVYPIMFAVGIVLIYGLSNAKAK
jgi:hypothetical protein